LIVSFPNDSPTALMSSNIASSEETVTESLFGVLASSGKEEF
jgi:hypothetical protein